MPTNEQRWERDYAYGWRKVDTIDEQVGYCEGFREYTAPRIVGKYDSPNNPCSRVAMCARYEEVANV